jgi:phospho-N-acetylmuramoyl-pentapeptide-transferase
MIEALSVIIQVASFKMFKRRVFKMSPLHHHFELLGIPENKVVYGFWAVQLLLCIIGVMIL